MINDLSSATLTAPGMRLKTTLSVLDQEERKSESKIHVISDQVEITPHQASLTPGQSAVFKGLFGTEECTFTWPRGMGVRDGADDFSEYTAEPLTYTTPAAPWVRTWMCRWSCGSSVSTFRCVRNY